MDQRCCGNCFWWKPTATEAWAAPVQLGKCTFGPAPAAIEGHRGMSANGGRDCLTFAPADQAAEDLARP